MSVQLLTAEQAAAQLAIKPSAVYRLIRRGELPAIRIGRLVRVHPDDLSAWVEHQREGGRRR